MTDEVTVVVSGPAEAAAALDDICSMYDEVFSQPPFFWRDDESVLHRRRLTGLLDDPSFGVVLATVRRRLIGFGYGFTLAADTRRWQHVRPSLPAEVMVEYPGRTFMLFDFAVSEAYRGRGIGRRLHDRLLGSRDEERATLTVQPTAVDTKAIYESWGWRKIGEMDGGPTAAAPVFDAYLRTTLEDLRSSQPRR
jgi:ribosomal protein S18 acetylase RimI-like enzyme